LMKIADDLNSKEFTQALKRFTDAENAAARAESDRFLTRISSASPDEVVNTIFKNGQAANIAQAKEILKGTGNFERIQQESMRDLMRLTTGPGAKVDEVFNPEALERALNSKGDDVLREMFGKETVESLRSLVRDLRVMTAAEKGGAGTLIAGAVAINAFNIAMLPTLAKLGIFGMIMRNPAVVRRFAKSDPESVNIVYQAVKDAVRLTGPVTLGQEVVEGSREAAGAAEAGLSQLAEDLNLGDITQQLNKELRTSATQITPKRLTAQLDLPEVSALPAQTSGIMSPSLLGTSPANIDIAQRLSNIA